MAILRLQQPTRERDRDQPALRVERLSAGYPGNRQAIRDVSFTVESGERVAVIGPNGAGKSTLFKAIVGVLPFSAGQISIHGADCYSSHIHVGYVPQQSAIDWSFPASVFDVVLMGRCRHIGWFRLPRSVDHDIARDILERLSLNALANRQISELSGGQRRRVFIARAMAQDTSIMVLDEPFVGVDQNAEQEIIETLDILTNHGISILLSTHHLEESALRFDKLLILNGKILAYGAPAAVMTPENLTRAFGGSLPVFAHGDELLMFSNDKNGGAPRGHR
ncbi:MAG: metal ABC transporter ATP-binding protein [Chloroflexota bacterium]|nr:metal ABC transporter ATP-binding protein [Chloroflexota bacterium]